MAALIKEVQEATGENVEVAYVDHGYTGDTPRQEAAQQGVDLIVVKTRRGQTGIRAPAQTLGCRTILCVCGTLSTIEQRL